MAQPTHTTTITIKSLKSHPRCLFGDITRKHEMNPSHITPAPDIYSNIIKYIYSNAKNLKLITNIKKLSNTIGCKPETILLIINKHSKLTTLSCNNTIAIRIKQ